MEFGNPIVGNEDLIRSAIKSPNFNSDPETGNVTGWRIAKDGTATFYNLIVGNANYNIDENGNAVFQSVSAVDIVLNGNDLQGILDTFPKGILALTRATSDTAATTAGGLAGGVLWNRIIITDFDSTRQYKIYFIAHIDINTASSPTYVSTQCYFKWGSAASLSDTLLFEHQWGGRGTSNTDLIASGAHTINNPTPQAADMHLAFYVTASNAGVKYQGESYGRVWIEDIGPALTYDDFNPGSGGNPVQQYTKTYSATSTASYQSSGSNRGLVECYQGYYSSTNGNGYSMIGFSDATIRSDLAGATIQKVELFLTNKHWYQNSGGTAVIGTHNQSSLSGSHPSSQLTDDIIRYHYDLGQAKWVDIGTSIGNALRDNTAKGICLGPGPTTSSLYYGYFAGNGQTGEPQLRITYTK